jgi:hypothetical protein
MTDEARIERLLDRLEDPNLTDRQIKNLERQLDRLRGETADQPS